MKNIAVIINSSKLNANSVCRACYNLKNGKSCNAIKCIHCEFYNNVKACFDYLQAEFKPKIKLTKFEYEMLKAFTFDDDDNNYTFGYFEALRKMKYEGYFKNVNTLMMIKDILATCEVEED